MLIKMNDFFTKKKKGQGLVEYGLILALVAIVAIFALTTMGQRIGSTLNDISETMQQQMK